MLYEAALRIRIAFLSTDVPLLSAYEGRISIAGQDLT